MKEQILAQIDYLQSANPDKYNLIRKILENSEDTIARYCRDLIGLSNRLVHSSDATSVTESYGRVAIDMIWQMAETLDIPIQKMPKPPMMGEQQ